MADLISTLVWQPMGAERDGEITCDPLGAAIHDGGVSATARAPWWPSCRPGRNRSTPRTLLDTLRACAALAAQLAARGY